MIVEAQVTIKGTKSSVWKTIAEVANMAEIIRGVEKIEILSESLNGLIGLRWRETRIYFGNQAAVEKWITDAVDDEFYKTIAEAEGFAFITTMTVTEGNGSVMLSSSHETKAQNFAAKLKSLPMIFFKGILRKAILEDLHDIKSWVEKMTP